MCYSALKVRKATNNIIANVPTFISFPETNNFLSFFISKEQGKSPSEIVLYFIVSKMFLIPSDFLSCQNGDSLPFSLPRCSLRNTLYFPLTVHYIHWNSAAKNVSTSHLDFQSVTNSWLFSQTESN